MQKGDVVMKRCAMNGGLDLQDKWASLHSFTPWVKVPTSQWWAMPSGRPKVPVGLYLE